MELSSSREWLSCAKTEATKARAAWHELLREGCEGIVLLIPTTPQQKCNNLPSSPRSCWSQDGGLCPPSHVLMLPFLLQVPHGEWNSTLSRDKDSEIPCRRMRSGSYIKAMGDDDSEDSETSPKPSPKTAARRQSYLKATQQSLSEQSTTQR